MAVCTSMRNGRATWRTLHLHRREQAEVPQLAADLVPAVLATDQGAPAVRSAAADGPSSGVPDRWAISDRDRRGLAASKASRTASAREVTDRPGVVLRPAMPPLFPVMEDLGLGALARRPYRPGMTGTTSASRLAPAAVPPRAGRAAHARRLPRLQEHGPARAAAHADRPAARLTEITGPVLGEDRVRRPTPT